MKTQGYSAKLAERLASAPTSTAARIINGEATIRKVDAGPGIRSVDGTTGNVSTHEVTIPGHKSDGSEWNTYLNYWTPSATAVSSAKYRSLLPQPRLTILANEAEMPFTRDRELQDAVVAAIFAHEDVAVQGVASPE